MPVFEGDLGEEEAGLQRQGGTHAGRTPQGPTGTWVQAKGGKGGSALAWERRKMQERVTGRRDERQRLAGDGGGGGD